MGARGKLKLPQHLRPVPDGGGPETAADRVPPVAPLKPEDVVLDPALSALWDEIVPQLDKAGLVAPSDAPAIELALRHFQMARQAYRQVGGDVMVPDHGHGGVKKNPAEAVFRSESLMFLEYAKQLGMVFVSRARTVVKDAGGGEQNPFAPTQASG